MARQCPCEIGFSSHTRYQITKSWNFLRSTYYQFSFLSNMSNYQFPKFFKDNMRRLCIKGWPCNKGFHNHQPFMHNTSNRLFFGETYPQKENLNVMWTSHIAPIKFKLKVKLKVELNLKRCSQRKSAKLKWGFWGIFWEAEQ